MHAVYTHQSMHHVLLDGMVFRFVIMVAVRIRNYASLGEAFVLLPDVVLEASSIFGWNLSGRLLDLLHISPCKEM